MCRLQDPNKSTLEIVRGGVSMKQKLVGNMPEEMDPKKVVYLCFFVSHA